MVRKDLELDRQLQPKLNENGVFASVSGRSEFEQSVVVRIHDEEQDLLRDGLIGENTEEKVQLMVSRIAKEHDFIDDISYLEIDAGPRAEGRIEITIVYESGGAFTESLN